MQGDFPSDMDIFGGVGCPSGMLVAGRAAFLRPQSKSASAMGKPRSPAVPKLSRTWRPGVPAMSSCHARRLLWRVAAAAPCLETGNPGIEWLWSMGRFQRIPHLNKTPRIWSILAVIMLVSALLVVAQACFYLAWHYLSDFPRVRPCCSSYSTVWPL